MVTPRSGSPPSPTASPRRSLCAAACACLLPAASPNVSCSHRRPCRVALLSPTLAELFRPSLTLPVSTISCANERTQIADTPLQLAENQGLSVRSIIGAKDRSIRSGRIAAETTIGPHYPHANPPPPASSPPPPPPAPPPTPAHS